MFCGQVSPVRGGTSLRPGRLPARPRRRGEKIAAQIQDRVVSGFRHGLPGRPADAPAAPRTLNPYRASPTLEAQAPPHPPRATSPGAERGTDSMNDKPFSLTAPIAILGLAALWASLPAPTGARQPQSTVPDPGLGIATVRLWDGAAPGALGSADSDIPTLTTFLPRRGKGNGTAVIVAPGGAYLGLASDLEGREVADWFAARGVAAFVLKYRLGPRYLYPVPLVDAQRAIRLVRSDAARYLVSQSRIGMAGFSAGGHLAAMAGTLFDGGKPGAADPVERMGSRPDFLVLGYPWIDAMRPGRPGFIPSYQTLMKLPQERHQEFEARYDPTALVTAQTPPSFIFHTSDDGVVPVEASVGFYSALHAAGVPAELHVFRHGNHGSGLGSGDPALDAWPALLEQWLREQGLFTAEPAAAPIAEHAPAPAPGRAGATPQ